MVPQRLLVAPKPSPKNKQRVISYLLRILKDIKSNNLDVTMEQIGQELAEAHAKLVAVDSKEIANLLSPQQVADYHHNVFKNHGIPKYIFGGTQTIFVYPKPGVRVPLIRFKANDYSNMWCKGCDK